MKDLELTLRVRNNRLKQRRDELGLSQRKLAAAVDISLSDYGALETLRHSPRDKHGEWREIARKIAAFHCVKPEELFPPTVQAVEHPVAVRKVDAEELRTMLTSHQQRMIEAPDVTYDRAEFREQMTEMIATLTPREAEILRLRFGLDDGKELTLNQIVKMFGQDYLTIERVRQIEAKALRKLRHPSRSRELRTFYDEHKRSGGESK